MKSVLLSIRPKWCEKILSGEKTIEVRKSAPKIVPFKCYIYCTKNKEGIFFTKEKPCDETAKYIIPHIGNGKVIGEFICDKVDKFNLPYPAYFNEVPQEVKDLIKSACLTMTKTHHYLGQKAGYGWHISDLKIYDKPRELSEFGTIAQTFKKTKELCEGCPRKNDCYLRDISIKRLTRAPQSWQYVEEVEE